MSLLVDIQQGIGTFVKVNIDGQQDNIQDHPGDTSLSMSLLALLTLS